MLTNAYLLAKIGADTAESEPAAYRIAADFSRSAAGKEAERTYMYVLQRCPPVPASAGCFPPLCAESILRV